MADLTVRLDAKLSLEETRKRCEFEQGGGFQLDMITFGTVIQDGNVIPVNKASFTAKKLNLILDELTFVDIEGKDRDTVAKEMKSEGRTLIAQSEIFVETRTTKVMIFGKNV